MRKSRERKIQRAAAKILPFRGTITWPLPDEIEPIEIAHPPAKSRANRRIPLDTPKDVTADPKRKAPDFNWLPQG